MRRRMAALVRKEFSQLFRDVPMLLILGWAFTGAIYTSGHGIATELYGTRSWCSTSRRAP